MNKFIDFLHKKFGLRIREPNPNECFDEFYDRISEEYQIVVDFERLPIQSRGQSKEIRNLDDNFVAIKYIPSISSHTHNKFGMLPGSDHYRLRMTANIFSYLNSFGFDTAFIGRINDLLIFERVDEIPIEIIFKYYHVGTPTLRYLELEKFLTRCNNRIAPGNRYPESPVIRFDWRNTTKKLVALTMEQWQAAQPFLSENVNVVDDNGFVNVTVKQGKEPDFKRALSSCKDTLPTALYNMLDRGHFAPDEVLCEDMAHFFIDVRSAKETTRLLLKTLQSLFSVMGLELWDGCITLDSSGKRIFGEISFDCLRIKSIKNPKESYDKDLFREGMNQDEMLKRFRYLNDRVADQISKLRAGYETV